MARIAALLIYPLWLLSLWTNSSVHADIREIMIPVTDAFPTQMEIGKAHVEFSKKKILSRNPNLALSVPTRALPGVIRPDGKIDITDGHHWASAAQALAAEHPELAGQIKFRVEISADFTGRSWDDYARYLHDHGIGYFTPEVRALYEVMGLDGKKRIPAEKLAEMYRLYLPKTLGGLKNNPGRSVVGLALEKMEISAEHDLVDYIEFYVVEDYKAEFKRLGVDFDGLQDPALITETVEVKAMRIFATDSKMIAYVLERYRPGMDPGPARKHVLDAINHYRVEKLALRALDPAEVLSPSACVEAKLASP